jgi:hypothetical protein
MDLITFRCAACKRVLKIGADKAGRKAKCKCGAELTIPLVSEDLQAAAASAPPQKAAAADEDDDDSPGGYGFAEMPEPPPPPSEKTKEQLKEEAKKKKFLEEEVERKRRLRASLRKAPLDKPTWEKIRVGVLLVLVATYVWIGGFVLHKVIVVIGLFGPFAHLEYAPLAEYPTLIKQSPQEQLRLPPGEALELDRASFVIGLLAGSESVDGGLTLARISQILVLLQGLLAIAGCAICLVIPPRFGARGLAIAVLSLAGINLILQAVFKLLPLAGAMEYTMVPLVAPEITMTVANIERIQPLHVFWSDAALWEIIAALVIQTLFFLEPVFFCLYLRAVANQIREDRLEGRANGVILMALGTLFGLVAFYLMSVTGTSEVLVWVLRALYGLWVGFFLGQLGWYVVVLQWTRTLIANKLAEEETEPA